MVENGEVLYAVLSFKGHPDSGNSYFPVPLQVLTFKNGSDWVELDVDEKLLRDAPGFDKYNWPMQPTAEFIASVYDHYGHRPKVYPVFLTEKIMEKSIYLIVNVLDCIFSESSKNTVSDAAKFVRGLRCPENGLLNVLRYVSATISRTPCPQPNFLVRNTGYIS